MSKFQRDKGSRRELEFKHFCKDLGIECWRTAQVAGKATTGLNAKAYDLCFPRLPLNIDVKGCEQQQIQKWMEVALADTADGDMTAIAWKQSFKPWLIISPAAQFMNLVDYRFNGQPPEDLEKVDPSR